MQIYRQPKFYNPFATIDPHERSNPNQEEFLVLGNEEKKHFSNMKHSPGDKNFARKFSSELDNSGITRGTGKETVARLDALNQMNR